MTKDELKAMVKEELKAEGLEVAEEAAISACKAMFRVLPKIALATPNKYDDMAIPVLGVIEPALLKILDDINKADNE